MFLNFLSGAYAKGHLGKQEVQLQPPMSPAFVGKDKKLSP
jgi:hypothetical protein